MEKKIGLEYRIASKSTYLYVYYYGEYINMFIDVELKEKDDIYAVYKNGYFITSFNPNYTELKIVKE